MAISQMKKISIVFAKEKLDAVLQGLQELQIIQVRDLTQLTDWQEAFKSESVHLPDIHVEREDGQLLTGEEALGALSQRQQHLEQAVESLNTFLPKEGTISSLRKEPKSLTFAEIEQVGANAGDLIGQVNQKISHLHALERQIAENQAEISRLGKWQSLDVTPTELRQFDFIKAVIGTVPKTADDAYFRGLSNNPAIHYQEIFQSEMEYGLLLFFDRKEEIDLSAFHFKIFDYDRKILPAQAIEELQKSVDQWSAEREELLQELAHSQQDLQKLKEETDYIMNLYARQEVKKNLATTKHLAALEGWIEASQINSLRQALIQRFGSGVFVNEVDVAEEDWDEVPIKLKNHALIEPFELVTEMYSLPKYYEKDPTPILAPFYFTFFGMMVADLGYGLLLFIATFLVLKLFHLPKGTRRFVKFFNILSVAVSLWGIIYGSFFGYTMPFVLISTTTDVMTILIMSVAFGFITLITGLFLGGRQKVRLKEYASAYNDGFAWCLILIGVLMLVIGMFVPGMGLLMTIGAGIAITNAIGIVIVSVVQAKSLLGLGTGLYNLYNASGYVGDLVSFTRLMALGLSGASIGSAFNLIVGLFPPVGRFTIGVVLFILLHAINLFLSLLSGYVHGARLIFVEFFGKFYEGGGKPFTPLKSAEKYVKITKSHSEE
ncbi:V-type ATP synthase subunit I [Streptococcus caballi]|uniref:V-type ATP synthase subunit I n=1 Tax=Streptococcus caballi TaxID=439220 RepID=UPI0003712F14|nr:V-type ATP synthase subunit I [Streptococcus caballi]